jgi:hypothetical protein
MYGNSTSVNSLKSGFACESYGDPLSDYPKNLLCTCKQKYAVMPISDLYDMQQRV